MANGKFVWTPRGGTQQSYTFPYQYSFGYEAPEQEAGDVARAIEGTLRSYARSLKQRWMLPFHYYSFDQKEQFRSIKAAQVEIDYYDDADGPLTCTALWINDFNFVMVAPGLWSGTIELQEI